MCECCVAQCDDYGEFLPGWYLVRATRDSDMRMKAGDWGLVKVNAPSFVFTLTPVKDPTVGLTDKEMDAEDPKLTANHNTFIETAESIGEDMFNSVDMSVSSIPFHAYGELYAACVSAGANGHIFHWLCNHIATYLENKPNIKK